MTSGSLRVLDGTAASTDCSLSASVMRGAGEDASKVSWRLPFSPTHARPTPLPLVTATPFHASGSFPAADSGPSITGVDENRLTRRSWEVGDAMTMEDPRRAVGEWTVPLGSCASAGGRAESGEGAVSVELAIGEAVAPATGAAGGVGVAGRDEAGASGGVAGVETGFTGESGGWGGKRNSRRDVYAPWQSAGCGKVVGGVLGRAVIAGDTTGSLLSRWAGVAGVGGGGGTDSEVRMEEDDDEDEPGAGQSLSGISMSELSAAAFETLYFLQKNESYKKIYIAAKLASCLFVIQLCLGNSFKPDSLLVLTEFLRIFSLPAPELPLETFYFAYCLAAVLVVATVSSMCFVTYSLAKGSLSHHWPARLLRFLLGIVQTFSDPLAPILLAFLDCRYFDVGEDEPFGQNHNWNITCASGGAHITMFALSITLFTFFAISLMYSTIMHVNDPGSYNLLARAHSRLDILQQGLNLFLVVAFLLLRDFPAWLAFLYTCCQMTLLVLFLVFQPYYHGFMNDLTTALTGVTVWTGIVFSVAVATSEFKSDSLGYLFLAGLLPAFGAAWIGSQLWRQGLVNRTLAQFAQYPDAESVPYIDDDDVFPVISREYDPNRSSWFPKALSGALVEVRTRFLQTDRSPRAVAIAYNLFKTGLIKHPQSGYLRLQYLSFLVCYTGNVSLASHRLTEFSKVSLDWDLGFSLLRKRRELQRHMLKEHLGADITNMDSIGFEEIKKMIKVANKQQGRSLQLVRQLWTTLLSQKSTQAETEALIPIFEDIHKAEHLADRAYAYLMNHTNDSIEVLSSYARYLRQVKDNPDAAADLEEKCEEIRQSFNRNVEIDYRRETKSTAMRSAVSPSVVSSQGKRAGQSSLIMQQSQRVFRLKIQLQGCSLLLLGMLATIFSLYLFGLEDLQPVFISSNESGSRRYYTMEGGLMARNMHIAALNNNEKAFNESRAELIASMRDLAYIHNGLVHSYGTSLQRLEAFYNVPELTVTSALLDDVEKSMVNGDELVMRFVFMGQKVSKAPMARFLDFNHSNPMSFPEYFYLLENSLSSGEHMDTATIMYQVEANVIEDRIVSMLFICSSVAVVLEICLVLLVFRPSINTMFLEFNQSTSRFLAVPRQALKLLVQSSKASQSVAQRAGSVLGSSSPRRHHDEHEDFPAEIEEGGGDEVRLNDEPEPEDTSPPNGAADDKEDKAEDKAESASNTDSAGPSEAVTPYTLPSSQPRVALSVRDFETVLSAKTRRPVPFLHHVAPIGPESPTKKAQPEIYTRRLSDTSLTDPPLPGSPAPSPSLAPIPGPPLPPFPKPGQLEPMEALAPSPKLTMSPRTGFLRSSGLPSQRKEVKFHSTKSTDPPPLVQHLQDLQAGEDNDRASVANFHAITASSPPTPVPSGVAGRQRFFLGALSSVTAVFKDMFEMVRSQRAKRKALLVFIYYTCLICISLCLFTLAYMGWTEMNTIRSSANELNSAGRLRYLGRRLGYVAQELALSKSDHNLQNGFITHFRTTNRTRCELNTAARAFYQTHYALLYGYDIGYEKVQRAHDWPDITTKTPCQPFTSHSDLFQQARELRGSVGRWKGHEELYFEPNCLTELHFKASSVTMSNKRLKFFSDTFDKSLCTFYKQGDPAAIQGLHRLLEAVGLAYLRFSKIDDERLSKEHIDYQFATRYQEGSPELAMGMVKSFLYYQHEALTALQSNADVMAFLFAFVVLVLLVQYAILGRRIEALMGQNLMMILIMERLLLQAKKMTVSTDSQKRASMFNDIVQRSLQAPPLYMPGLEAMSRDRSFEYPSGRSDTGSDSTAGQALT
eukprot:CAMPEP_0114572710 /NCGR_PEP_ID=MMETSP0114-20121206/18452_1 /TAXON_ID=31324 /ORGANISM="Goniomonas sp, Strain m" /LENGTH=1798 /DNA_ID=CAMNT_0001759969 /DNA_START=409 /DNA_END=5806 /DNA_ORIENTATION=+